MAEQWVTMKEAARDRRVSPSKLSRLAQEGKIQTRKDPRDERKTLVNLAELRRMFPD